jgi:hypothetical protein
MGYYSQQKESKETKQKWCRFFGEKGKRFLPL